MGKRYKSVDVKVMDVLEVKASEAVGRRMCIWLEDDVAGSIESPVIHKALFSPKLTVDRYVREHADSIPEECDVTGNASYVGLQMYDLPQRSDGWPIASLEYSDSGDSTLWFTLALRVREHLEKIVSIVEEVARARHQKRKGAR